MSEQKINPKVVLEAARMAEPVNINGEKLNWRILDGVGVVNGRFVEEQFDPLTSDDDAMKLERALKQRGNGWWAFSKTIENQYQAISAESGAILLDDPDTLLLLKCVAAMKSLELFGEGE